MLSNKYAESYKYFHIMNIICSYMNNNKTIILFNGRKTMPGYVI